MKSLACPGWTVQPLPLRGPGLVHSEFHLRCGHRLPSNDTTTAAMGQWPPLLVQICTCTPCKLLLIAGENAELMAATVLEGSVL